VVVTFQRCLYEVIVYLEGEKDEECGDRSGGQQGDGGSFEQLFGKQQIIRDKCCQLGPIYLVYVLLLDALAKQDSSVQYLSWALSYFNKVVHLDLMHREKIEVMMKMHTIQNAIVLMQTIAQEVSDIASKILSVALSGGTGLSSDDPTPTLFPSVKPNAAVNDLWKSFGPLLFDDTLVPYLSDLSDAYSYLLAFLVSELNETFRLDAELDVIMVMVLIE
jgi:hypothetical protein